MSFDPIMTQFMSSSPTFLRSIFELSLPGSFAMKILYAFLTFVIPTHLVFIDLLALQK